MKSREKREERDRDRIIVQNKNHFYCIIAGEFCRVHLIAGRNRKRDIRMRHLSAFKLGTCVALQLYHLYSQPLLQIG